MDCGNLQTPDLRGFLRHSLGNRRGDVNIILYDKIAKASSRRKFKPVYCFWIIYTIVNRRKSHGGGTAQIIGKARQGSKLSFRVTRSADPETHIPLK